MTIKTIYFH